MWHKEAHKTGAISEKKAQLHFMKQGFDVFIPCHGGTRSDFIAVWNGHTTWRVQVKTAQYNKKYIQCRLDVHGKRYTKEDTDVVVFVLDERMWVIPIREIDSVSSVCLGKIDDPNYKARTDFSNFEVH